VITRGPVVHKNVMRPPGSGSARQGFWRDTQSVSVKIIASIGAAPMKV
jgi:hypothetical protein